MAKRSSTRRFGPAVAVLVAAVLVLVGAEAAARVIEPRVGAVPRWADADTDLEVEQMRALSADGGADVVFLGSSIVNVGIDPDAFVANSDWATSAYNASLSAASPRLLELWAAEVVLPLLEPKVVVIGLSSRSLNANGENQQLAYDRYTDSIGRAEHLGEASVGQSLQFNAEGLSALARIRGEIRSPSSFLSKIGAGGNEGSPITNDGYDARLRDRTYGVSAGFRERMTENVLNDYEVGGEELAAVERLIESAERAGAAVYVVDMPVVAADYVPLHPRGSEDHEMYEAAFDALSDYERLEARTAMAMAGDPSLHADPLHLNAKGADLLAEWLATAIPKP